MNLNERVLVATLSQTINQVFNKCRDNWALNVKSMHDYVTDVDTRLEEEIKECIVKKFPNHQVIGEESIPEHISFDEPTWVIDPLDGTSNFVFGVPFYGCSIALVYDRRVEFAFVMDLVNQDTFTARRGKGAFLNGRPISTHTNSSDYIGLSSGFLDRAAMQEPSLITSLRASGKFRILGAQALHLCYVAAGRFKSSVSYEAKVWDDIAGALIVKEAGGFYQSRSGFDTEEVASFQSEQSLFSVASAHSLEADLNISKDQLFKIL